MASRRPMSRCLCSPRWASGSPGGRCARGSGGGVGGIDKARIPAMCSVMSQTDPLSALESVIRERMQADPDSSYVARLHAKGRAKIAQKVGEEAVETVIAAMAGNAEELTSEAADLLFHLLVLLAESGLSLDDVRGELARREGVSGLEEKASRQG